MASEYGRFPTTSINTNRVPVTVQGLPAQASTYIIRNGGQLNTSQMSPNPYFSNVERHQQPGSRLSSYQGSHRELGSIWSKSTISTNCLHHQLLVNILVVIEPPVQYLLMAKTCISNNL